MMMRVMILQNSSAYYTFILTTNAFSSDIFNKLITLSIYIIPNDLLPDLKCALL